MNKKKLLTLVLSLVLIGAVGVGATLAYFTDTDNVTNTLTMGKVDIDLDEEKFDTNDDDIAEKGGILPGQVFEKDPTIKVKAGSADAKIRVKIDVKGTTENGAPLTQADIDAIVDNLGITADWEENADGYYYYVANNEKASAGMVIPVFTQVKIPETWNNTYASTSFQIVVSAQAIQADGPWAGVTWESKEVVEFFDASEDGEVRESNAGTGEDETTQP